MRVCAFCDEPYTTHVEPDGRGVAKCSKCGKSLSYFGQMMERMRRRLDTPEKRKAEEDSAFARLLAYAQTLRSPMPMSDPKPLTNEEIAKLRACHVFGTPQEVFDQVCAQAEEANDLRDTVAALTDLDEFDVRVSKAGAVQGSVKGAGAGLIAAILAKPLFDSEAPNYVEGRFTVTNPKTKVPVEMVHTVQRVTGKSPHEKRQEAETALRAILSFSRDSAPIENRMNLIQRYAKDIVEP